MPANLPTRHAGPEIQVARVDGRRQAGREGSLDGHGGATVGSGTGEDVRGGGGARRSWGEVMAAWFPCHARTYGVIDVVTP